MDIGKSIRNGFFHLDVAQWSLQFSDPRKQQKHDVREIFIRDYHWVCGTEAGNPFLQDLLRDQASDNGYKFFVFKSNWVSVHEDMINKGTYKTKGITVLDNDDLTTHGNDPSLSVVSFENEYLGDVTLIESHYPRDGSPAKEYHPNLKANKEIASTIGEVAEKASSGTGLTWYHGDQNMNDRIVDTFLNRADLTSIQDELKKWENTGFGTYDVIASFNDDRRVQGEYVRALDDSELRLFLDHNPVEAGFKVRLLEV